MTSETVPRAPGRPRRRNLLHLTIAALAVGVLALFALSFLAGEEQPGGATAPNLYEAAPADAVRVLFVGNSHTFFHHMPAMVQHLAHHDPRTPPLWFEMVAYGGFTLGDHSYGGNARPRMQQGGWDHVVLQGASLEPFHAPEHFVEHFRFLAAEATQAGATPILYQTWPRAHWDPVYAEPWMPDDPGMALRTIRDVTTTALDNTTARLAPVGEAWDLALRRHPDIELYDLDGNHATVAGSYLAACTIYRQIAGQPLDVGQAWHPRNLPPDTAARLQDVANRTATPSEE